MDEVRAPTVDQSGDTRARDDVRNLDELPADCEYWVRVPNLDIVPGLDDPGECVVSPFQL